MKTEVQRGTLLIASLGLMDPNFQRTVVLLCEHEEDQGTYGLVLNRPIDVPSEIEDELGFARGRLFVGGPVQQQALQALHRYGDRVPGSRLVADGIWVGGDFEVLKKGVISGELDPDHCRFYLGYAGWAAGQLASEFEMDSWLTAPACPEIVFETSAEQMWQRAVRARAIVEPMFAFFPDDPRQN